MVITIIDAATLAVLLFRLRCWRQRKADLVIIIEGGLGTGRQGRSD